MAPWESTGQPRCGTWLAPSEFKDNDWQRFEKRKALWVQMLHLCQTFLIDIYYCFSVSIFNMYTSKFYRTIEYAYILFLINVCLFSVLLSSQIHISFNSTFNWNARASPFSDSLECCLSQELIGKTEVWAHQNRQHNFAYFPQPLKSEVPLGYIKSLSKKPSWSSLWNHKS